MSEFADSPEIRSVVDSQLPPHKVVCERHGHVILWRAGSQEAIDRLVAGVTAEMNAAVRELRSKLAARWAALP